jgi:hypothetical protein
MNWLSLVSYFFGGAFAANAVPHLTSGLSGRAFQSPFAKPPGRGLSSATVNFLWGFVNAGIAYLLVLRVGEFHLRSWHDIGSFALGVMLLGLFCARHFGQFHGGADPSAHDR